MKAVPAKELTLFDSTCLIVGIIIGVGIYQMAPDVARGVSSGWEVMALWIVGGLISLCGAFGYAELATAYPQAGGDYVFLNRAYGPWAGFLFGWIQLAVVRPGDIAVMAFGFAMYARTLYDPLAGTAFPYTLQCYAIAAVLILTAINLVGVRQGKWTQNVLTVIKVLGMLAIVGVALAAPAQESADPVAIDPIPLSVAMIFVLFTFGGWNEMAYVAAEVKNPNRNIVRALVLGTVAVTVLYLLANTAFLHTLGYSKMATSQAVAADSVASLFPDLGSKLISALICISALGAVSGLIFAGARISYAVGADHGLFRVLGRWHFTRGTPVWALVVQALICVILILVLGNLVNTVLYTAAAVYTFYLATSAAVMVLRVKEPDVPRAYRVTGYPYTTLLFCGVCTFLIYSAVTYKPMIAAFSCGILLLGVPLYLWTRRYGVTVIATGLDTKS